MLGHVVIASVIYQALISVTYKARLSQRPVTMSVSRDRRHTLRADPKPVKIGWMLNRVSGSRGLITGILPVVEISLRATGRGRCRTFCDFGIGAGAAQVFYLDRVAALQMRNTLDLKLSM